MNEHKDKLQELAQSYQGIKKRIANHALEYDNLRMYLNHVVAKPNIETYLGDMPLSTFFARYYDEIEKIRMTHEQKTGTPVIIKGDTMVFLSNLAIGILALEVAGACGFEIVKNNGSYILK
jgi:hypothetical protein